MEQQSKADKEMKEIVYAISHDLQSPLRIVNSYLKMLSRKLDDASVDSSILDFVSEAQEGAHQMQRYLEDLLRYSRLVHAKPSVEPIDLVKIIDKVAIKLSVKQGADSYEIQQNVESFIVEADPRMMQTLLEEVIDNAIKFAPDGQKAKISISAKEHSFIIADNGIGIPENYKDAVFLLYKQLHPKGKYPGSGTGLALCKKIMEMHNGSIEAIPQESGVVFEINFSQ